MGAEEKQREQEAKPRSSSQTITQAQFLSWKRHKVADDSARKDEAARKRQEDVIAGIVPMNGRELFLHEPWVFDNTRY